MKKVLIVEDDLAWAKILERYVGELNYKSKIVVSGGQAMEAIDSWRPDALLLDMLLAGETGVALLHELRSHEDLAKLPVIVCSSVEIGEEQLSSFGVAKVLDKSRATPDEIRSAIREVLACAERGRGARANGFGRWS